MAAIGQVMRSKFRGCLIGALIGDCIGSPFEGESQVMKGMLNAFFSKLLVESNQRALQIYSYTDDTAMTKSVAESLSEHNSFNAADLATRFTVEYFKQPRRGYGNTVIDIFQAWNDNNVEDPFEPATRQFDGNGSLGNGAAMRIAPVALFGSLMSDEQLIDLVTKTSSLTHTHPYGINGAILQSFAIKSAVNMTTNGSIITPNDFNASLFLDGLIMKMKPIEEAAPEVKKPEGKNLLKKSGQNYHDTSKTPFTDKLIKIKSIVENGSQGSALSSEEVAAVFGNSVSALGSVPTAIYSVIRAHSPLTDFNLNHDNDVFIKTLFDSISFAGDTDTIASMACSITGSIYGEDAILPILKRHCEYYKEIIILADKLYDVTFNSVD